MAISSRLTGLCPLADTGDTVEIGDLSSKEAIVRKRRPMEFNENAMSQSKGDKVNADKRRGAV